MTGRLLILFFALLLGAGANAYTVKDVPNVHLTDSRRYTSDPDNILSPRAHAVIDSLAADLRSRTSSELAVVIVNDIDGAEPEQFATALFNDWRIGKKESNNGVLVLVVMDENYCIIRTGYGAEGVLPDITTGRIRREIMNPYFRNGQPDSAMTEGVRAIHTVITQPDAAAELLANYERNREQREAAADRQELLSLLAVSAVFGGFMAFLLIFLYFRNRRKYGGVAALPKLYQSTMNLRAASLGTAFFGLGLPLFAYFFLRGRLKSLRHTPPRCSGCSTPMTRLDKQQGFAFLTPVQQTEQRLGSADYDVWRCPADGQTVTREFPGSNSSYTRCPRCGARARHLVSDRILVPSTTIRQGQGQRHYHCEHCGNDDYTTYQIPRKAPVVVVGGGRGFGGGGGGFSGGSFGGGFSGGGGSGGRW